MQKVKRHQVIDLLRGLAIFSMILIHTNAYFLSNTLASLIWDLNEFAVPVFIFCSAYIFFHRQLNGGVVHIFSYVKKRFIRLLMPYYIFVACLFGIKYFLDPKQLTPDYITKSILLIGGIDINWLVLLFLTLSILFPLLYWLYAKQKVLWYALCTSSLASSIYFLFYKPSFNYKFIMWLPWLLIAIFSLYFVKWEQQKKFFAIGIPLWFIITLAARQLLAFIHHPLIHYQNKYPPNLYHLAYGIFFIMVLYLVFKKGWFDVAVLSRPLHFLSRYSYSIFFIHYVVIYLVAYFMNYSKLHWYGFFIFVLFITVSIQYFYNILISIIKPKANEA